MMFRKTIKYILLLLVIAVALFAIYQPFSLREEVEDMIADKLEEFELDDIEVEVREIKNRSISIARIAFTKDEYAIEAKDIRITADSLSVIEFLQDNYDNLSASWEVDELQINGSIYPFPYLMGKGDVRFLANQPEVSGQLHSVDNMVDTEFWVNESRLKFAHITLPWEGAKISAEDIDFSFTDPEPIYVILRVESLELSRLLTLLTGNRVSGTGKVSGALPVFISPDGGFMPGNGHFTTKGDGTLSISPETLPGDSEQMEVARKALTNFHYNKLLLESSMNNETSEMSLSLKIEGSNPNAFDGRQINLNVNLTGDVLQMLEQSLLPSANPTRFLEKNE